MFKMFEGCPSLSACGYVYKIPYIYVVFATKGGLAEPISRHLTEHCTTGVKYICTSW